MVIYLLLAAAAAAAGTPSFFVFPSSVSIAYSLEHLIRELVLTTKCFSFFSPRDIFRWGHTAGE